MQDHMLGCSPCGLEERSLAASVAQAGDALVLPCLASEPFLRLSHAHRFAVGCPCGANEAPGQHQPSQRVVAQFGTESSRLMRKQAMQ